MPIEIPKSKGQTTHPVYVRLSPSEYNHLEKLAKQARSTVSTTARRIIEAAIRDGVAVAAD